MVRFRVMVMVNARTRVRFRVWFRCMVRAGAISWYCVSFRLGIGVGLGLGLGLGLGVGFGF